MTQDLRERVSKLEEEIADQEEIIKSLSLPPLRKGIITEVFDKKVEVIVGNQTYEVSYNPRMKDKLQRGKSVSLNNNYAIVDVSDPRKEGNVVVVSEVLDNNRVKVNINGNQTILYGNNGAKRGDCVVIDDSESVVLDNLGKQNKRFTLEGVPEIPWSKVGGLDHIIETIKDVIETPFLHKDLYKKYNKRVPKGVLLYGPPGCGKTLVAKAMAYNLAKSIAARTGNNQNGYFLNIKGPEILNKYVGASEETIRQIFASARDKSSETNEPVVIFIDEAESVFKRRGSGISTDIYDSIVPQFLAEMDGLDSNYNVVLVMATNREDMIDPAVLRPGRIDRKLEIPRPNDKGAKQIYDIYLKDMPFNRELRKAAKKAGFPEVDYLSSEGVKKLFSDESVLALMEFYDQTSEPVRYKNLVSGAIIEASVQRAADYAIKREIGNGKGNSHDKGLGLSDLLRAIDAEFKEMGQNVKRSLTESDIRSIANDRYDQIKDIRNII
ncbi:MAG: AAA family ATPase [Nanoarchaeota archaeon]|nr:AAA family ATPase [Nanoarchaeota archaeon]MBU1321052.1 AAA family ATPase [Nanoarchaeota archaeon]MBU1598121.1 AAA family ATPase [Nanoarchaeota archaeon]MBU2442315.1 AAA family ATPase [Nanoarchaeota archaeon]